MIFCASNLPSANCPMRCKNSARSVRALQSAHISLRQLRRTVVYYVAVAKHFSDRAAAPDSYADVSVASGLRGLCGGRAQGRQ